MLKSIHIRNFKCLRDVSVDVDPLTVFIGKNDTGKSSFLDAILELGNLVGRDSSLAKPRNLESITWRHANPAGVAWTVEVAPTIRNGLTGVASYSLNWTGDASHAPHVAGESFRVAGSNASLSVVQDKAQGVVRLREGDVVREYGTTPHAGRPILGQYREFPTLHAVASMLASTTMYRLRPSALARPSRLSVGIPVMNSLGTGLPTLLDYLISSDRKAFDTVEQELAAAVPFVRAIQLRVAAIGGEGPGEEHGKAINFELSPDGAVVPAEEVSDGVLLLLAYLTLVHSPSAAHVILLEEPENGVHPRQLARLARFLRFVTDPARGASRTQVILATHSPYFLDHIPPESVRVFGRKENGETFVRKMTDIPGVPERIEMGLSLGEMWFNVGEDKLLADEVSVAETPTDASPTRQ